MGALFGSNKPAPLPPAPAPVPPPPRNIQVGETAIDRRAQRRRSSLANAPGANRSLLNTDAGEDRPLGV